MTQVDGVNDATGASCDSVCKPGGNKLMTDLFLKIALGHEVSMVVMGQWLD